MAVGLVFFAEVIMIVLTLVYSVQAKDQVTGTLQEKGIPRYRDGDLDWDNFVDWSQETVE